MTTPILDIFLNASRAKKKMLAVLIDPDTPDQESLEKLVSISNAAGVDLFFVGGSLLERDTLDNCIRNIKSMSDIPVISFPGSILQISPQADAILFLSLISGRNPELLIGNHVISAPYIKQANLEALPTGYMLVDNGRHTTATYMSGSLPIPHHKGEIAACTAMAGEMLGLKLMYLDGGSGADKPVSTDMIQKVRQSVEAPIIVGGGIRNSESAREILQAGADVVVIGNITEDDPEVIQEMAQTVHSV